MPWGKPELKEPTITCSLTKSPTVYIEPTPRAKLGLLMAEYKSQEWLAYMVGRISEQDNIFVEDIVIPPHAEASGASAEAEPFHTPESCVGMIHSHHNMGAFHSGTDQAYVDKNYPVSITVARNGSQELVFDAVSYQKTPCGKAVTQKSVIKYVEPPALFDKEGFLKGAKANIDKGKKTVIIKNHGAVYPRHSVKALPYSGFVDKHNDEGQVYFTDDKGGVMTQAEIDAIGRQIWG